MPLQPTDILGRTGSTGSTTPHSPGVGEPSRRYVLISPCRDEAKFARDTIESVLGQTHLPSLWVIVDDGSRDTTPEILAEYAARYPWIRVVHRSDRGERVLGKGVMQAFYTGLETVDLSQFDYLCKLDLDLDLPEQYFAELIKRMEADPRLGCCSGKPYFLKNGRAVSERCGDEHAVGMTKFYRVECFQEIGGFVKELMWDGIDTHRCRMLGWKAASWEGDRLRFIHLRPMGTSHKNWPTGRFRHGRGQYFMGTHPLYMIVSAAYRLFHPPYIIGSLAMLWGYTRAMIFGAPRYDVPGFKPFLRKYQMACLAKGKARATAELEASQAAVWKPKSSAAPAER